MCNAQNGNQSLNKLPRKKFFSRIILTLFLLTAINVFADTKKIKIGAIASLTGPAAEQGKNWVDGATLAVKALEKQGISIEFIVEDDASKPAQVHTAFNKLVSIDQVQGVIGGTWDFLAEAANPLSLKYKIPFITPTNPVEILSKSAQKNPWVFTNGLSIRETEIELERVLRGIKAKSAAIVVPNLPFGIVHADAIERIAKRQGISIISRDDIEYAGYHDTLRSIALKLSRRKPDVVFCLTD